MICAQAHLCLFRKRKCQSGQTDEEETFGMLYMADVFSFEKIHSEIEKIVICEELIDNWTYPLIQPKLIQEAKNRGYL